MLYPTREEFMYQCAHHRLAASLLPQLDWEDLLEHSGRKDDPEIMISLLEKEIRGSRDINQVVISSELLAVGNLAEIALYFEPVRNIADFKIIVYIRNYPDFMESYLAHQVTCNDYVPEILTEKFMRDFCRGMAGHYRRVIDAYAQAFGKDNIKVRVLEQAQLYGGDIFSDFLHLLGLEKYSSYKDTGIRNPSLKRNGLEYMMILNRMKNEGQADPVTYRVIRMILKQIPDKQRCSFLPRSLRIEISEWCEQECEYIAREYLGRKNGVLFNDPGGKDLPGGETYQGLDPEYAVQAGKAMVEMALRHGAFKQMRNAWDPVEGREREPVPTLRGTVKRLVARVPGASRIWRKIRG